MCLGTSSLGWIQLHKLHFFPRKTNRVRLLRLTRKRRAGKDIKMKNLKLYIENISIQEENEKLRKKASLLHQENIALMCELQKRFPNCDRSAAALASS